MAIERPEHVRSLTLMVTTIDMRPALDAFQDNITSYPLPLAHGRALQAAIPGSTLFEMPGLGHSFTNREFFEPTVMNIVFSCAQISKGFY